MMSSAIVQISGYDVIIPQIKTISPISKSSTWRIKGTKAITVGERLPKEPDMDIYCFIIDMGTTYLFYFKLKKVADQTRALLLKASDGYYKVPVSKLGKVMKLESK